MNNDQKNNLLHETGAELSEIHNELAIKKESLSKVNQKLTREEKKAMEIMAKAIKVVRAVINTD